MGKAQYDQFIKENSLEDVGSDGAYDVAEYLMGEHPEVVTYLKHIGVKDVQGRIADDILN